MVEDELLAKELVERSDDKQRIGRVMRVDDVEAFLESDVDAHHQARAGEIELLRDVSDEHLQLVQYVRIPDGLRSGSLSNTVSRGIRYTDTPRIDLVELASPAARRAITETASPVLCKREGLIPDTGIRRKAVLHEHQGSTSRCLHTCALLRTQLRPNVSEIDHVCAVAEALDRLLNSGERLATTMTSAPSSALSIDSLHQAGRCVESSVRCRPC